MMKMIRYESERMSKMIRWMREIKWSEMREKKKREKDVIGKRRKRNRKRDRRMYTICHRERERERVSFIIIIISLSHFLQTLSSLLAAVVHRASSLSLSLSSRSPLVTLASSFILLAPFTFEAFWSRGSDSIIKNDVCS